ncbi:MAG: hypothetical protein NW224_29085 [Leptolyngbyaceae cyanobacterium bins.302]|nr:hypothetical protein [Leptolyngbyaceae cyanobacterium bins.302]
MKQLLVVLGVVLAPMSAIAAEWESVTQNSVGDRFLVDSSSIQRNADTVFYWEYREFSQANNAFLEEPVNQPVHGVVLNWSANCTSKTQRLRQVTAYDKERKVIKRFSYGENGTLQQPKSGSSTSKVLTYVCDRKEG